MDMVTKKGRLLGVVISIVFLCSACGSGGQDSDKLDGSLNDIMAGIYENADLDADFREGLANFETIPLTDDIELFVFGTDEIDYTEGIVSMPMMSSVAYQCVLLRVNEDDIGTVKQQISDNANLDKWICISAETMLVESRGDIVFFVMADNDTAYALNSAFQSY